MAVTVSLGSPYASSTCSIFLLCMESKALEKTTNNIVATRFFACTSSKFQRAVKISDVVDWFLNLWCHGLIIHSYIYIYIHFTHELNKNNKISFLDVLIDANNNNNFTTSTYKKPSSNNSCTLNFKSECPFRYKKAIIHNLISRAKLISSSKTIFYKEVENIKQALINNGFPNNIVDEQIKCMIKNVNQQNKQCTTPSSQQTYIKLFYRNQMHYNYKSDEKILKTLIHKNILPTDPNKKIKLVIYYNKFKTSNLVIRNNSSPSIGVLQKNNVIYKFKCPLGDCISDNNNIYVGLTSTTLSRRLTMHL